eukprot:TRINITY_DN78494_c0_g1_i1.p1 TRINITY_DN78494_c0_g1~~TRINITY_DN78494_c0_g1_i1.p1  ORF type:complete len:515 (-),score=56.74 TRINITY_DN78494_c0_g1_i1:767-2311(-)
MQIQCINSRNCQFPTINKNPRNNRLFASRYLQISIKSPRRFELNRRRLVVVDGVQDDVQKMRRKIAPFYGWVSKFINYQLRTAIVEIRHVFGKGRGLIAIDTIKKKQEILRIPRSLIMTADDAARQSLFGKAMKEQGLSDAAILTGHMTESYHASRVGKYPKNLRWKIYAQCLPRKTACLADWGRAQYLKVLHPKKYNLQEGDSSPFKDVLRTNSLVNNGIEDLEYATKELYDPIRNIRTVKNEPIINDTLTMKNIDFAVSQLHCRAIPVSFLNDKLAFLPFIDFMNHNIQDSSRLLWDEKRDELVLQAGRKYHKNEEVQINFYGKTNNRTHYFRHGFLPGTNNEDYFPHELGLDENDPYFEEKTQVLKDLGLRNKIEYRVPCKAAVPEDVLQFAQFAVCEPASADQLPQIASLILKDNKTLAIEGRNLKYMALPYIGRSLQKELNEYTEASAGDMNLVKDLRMIPNANLQFSEWVNCCAAALRKSERIILATNHTFVQMKIEELKAKARGQFL